MAYYILPQYFGIRLPGFDLTAQRMLITILCLFLLSKESRKKMFWEGVRSCRLWLFMAGYLGICFYTAVLRFHIGTFLYPFIELLGAFLVIYVLREYLGSDGFLVLFRRMLLFLCVLGLVEAVMRKTPFAYPGDHQGTLYRRHGPLRFLPDHGTGQSFSGVWADPDLRVTIIVH